MTGSTTLQRYQPHHCDATGKRVPRWRDCSCDGRIAGPRRMRIYRQTSSEASRGFCLTFRPLLNPNLNLDLNPPLGANPLRSLRSFVAIKFVLIRAIRVCLFLLIDRAPSMEPHPPVQTPQLPALPSVAKRLECGGFSTAFPRSCAHRRLP
jgi:hypothetical protein